MGNILIFGHEQSRHTCLYHILTRVGITAAEPTSEKCMAQTMLERSSVIASTPEHLDSGKSSREVHHKALKKLTNDVSMDESSQTILGWVSSDVTHLDSWTKSNPHIRFVLAYSSPEIQISEILSNKDSLQGSIEKFLTSWLSVNSYLKRFYENNYKQCILVNAYAAINAPAIFVERVGKLFDLKLHTLPQDFHIEDWGNPAIGAFSRKQVWRMNSDALRLYDRLEICADLKFTLPIQSASKTYQSARDDINSKCNAHFYTLEEDPKYVSTTPPVEKQVEQVSAAHRIEEHARPNSLEQVKKTQSDEPNPVSSKNKLSLLPLYRAQEELIRYLLQIQEFFQTEEQAIQNSQLHARENEEMRHKLSEEKEKLKQADIALQTVQGQLAELKSTSKNLMAAENEELQLQLQETKKELDKYVSLCKALPMEANQQVEVELERALPTFSSLTSAFNPIYFQDEDNRFKEQEKGFIQCELTAGKLDKALTLSHFDLDPITSILLHNSHQIQLDETVLNNFLASYRLLKKRKSEEAEIKQIDPIPKDWPTDLKLAPLPDSTNDYLWHMARKSAKRVSAQSAGLSVIIPTFNRAKILDITLACLVNQRTQYEFEVIVADDGSHEDLLIVTRKYETSLDIKLVRQRDYGYQLCAVRNLGIRCSKYRFLAILDCDMAPGTEWVQSYMELLMRSEDVALIGPRKYIDTSTLAAEAFLKDSNLLAAIPEVVTNNNVAGRVNEGVSIDWRLEHFKETENLRLCDSPFRYFSGGNVAFSKKWITVAGWFDEEFTHWGGEDNEFGYRLYRAGCFFRAVEGGLAYHQEPPGKENETDRAGGKAITTKIVEERVPYFYRKLQPIEKAVFKKVPLVSIYIPVYNNEKYIEKCVDSALNQTVTDLEVCICDDGSTDNTFAILKKVYGHNPRVRFISKENGGIASASNAAVKMCRGYYVAQLDSDDYLEPDAVELCLQAFMEDRKLACVYTTNRNVDPNGKLISKGYNWPFYSREKLTTAMICHHFRMFTARAWNLTNGFDEKLSNAVDYDMYLKLSEVGPFQHLNKVCYNRVLHGENTSIKKLNAQKTNHFCSINNSLKRQGIKEFVFHPQHPDISECRKYVIEQCRNNTIR